MLRIEQGGFGRGEPERLRVEHVLAVDQPGDRHVRGVPAKPAGYAALGEFLVGAPDEALATLDEHRPERLRIRGTWETAGQPGDGDGGVRIGNELRAAHRATSAAWSRARRRWCARRAAGSVGGGACPAAGSPSGPAAGRTGVAASRSVRDVIRLASPRTVGLVNRSTTDRPGSGVRSAGHGRARG